MLCVSVCACMRERGGTVFSYATDTGQGSRGWKKIRIAPLPSTKFGRRVCFVRSLDLKWPEGSDDHDEYKDARAVCVTSSRDIGSNSDQPSDSCSYDSIKELAADRGGSLPPIEYIELAGFGHETRFEAGAAFSVR